MPVRAGVIRVRCYRNEAFFSESGAHDVAPVTGRAGRQRGVGELHGGAPVDEGSDVVAADRLGVR